MNDLLKKLHSKSITINLIDDQLDIKAPKGAMTSELLSEIKEHKKDLIIFISNHEPTKSNSVSIPKASINESYPLSSSQYRLWLANQFENIKGVYNMPSAFEIIGDLDVNVLDMAFNALLERHEILRTIFKTNQLGEVRQFILPIEKTLFEISYFDVSKKVKPIDSVIPILEKEMSYHFDLATEMLLRIKVFKTGKNTYIMGVVMHHIISDGWSIEIMIKELLIMYAAFINDVPNSLKPFPIQYKDYASWHNNQLETKKAELSKAYWKTKLQGEIPVLNLQSNTIPRPVFKTYNGAIVKKKYTGNVIDRFNELCRKNDATLFMGLLATMKLLLFKYTNQKDIIIGSPIAGREHVDLQNQLGLYINTLALRSILDSEDSFKQLLFNVKETTLKAYEHQQFPFDQLVNDLKVKRDGSRHPLFDVMIIFQSMEDESSDRNILNDLSIKEIPLVQTVSSKFDLEFSFEQRGNILSLNITYNIDIHKEDFIVQLVNHFNNLLENVVLDPDMKISRLPMLNDREKSNLINDFNNTKIDGSNDETLVHVFVDQVKKRPNEIAVQGVNKEYTYAELNTLSDIILKYIVKNNVDVQAPIGVIMERSPLMIAILLGILKSKRPYIPIDPTLPEGRVKYIIEHSKLKLLISEDEKLFNDDSITILKIEDIIGLEKGIDETSRQLPNQLDTAYIIYTSGSTGKPKGVEISHGALLNFLLSMKVAPGMEAGETLFSVTTYSFDISILEFFVPLITGGKVYVADKDLLSNSNKIIETLETLKPNILQATPSFYQMLCESGWKGDKQLKILCGGDTLSESLAEKLLKMSREVWNMYGPTETTIWSSLKKLKNANEASNIGLPISNTQIYVLDSYMQILPINAVGKIYIGGDGLAKGYYRNDVLTKQKFVPSPFNEEQIIYETGDMGKKLPDGSTLFLGREDYQVKIRGFRIELGEIENNIFNYSPDIKQVIVNVKELNGEKVLVAYYGENNRVDKLKLKEHLQKTLPHYMIPNFYVALDSFPLTSNGKVNRKKLQEIRVKNIDRKEFVKPINDIEERLFEIWKVTFNTAEISVEDNFFELGGNSLFAIKIINKIAIVFKKTVSITELFTKNIKEIAILLENMGINSGIEIEVAEIQESYPLTPMQYAMWVSCQFGGVQAYNMPMAIEISGVLQIEKFKEAFDAVVKKYDVIRSEFIINDELEPRQVFKKASTFTYNFEYVELKEVDIETYLDNIFNNKFELSKSPLFRVGIIKVGPKKSTFYLNVHHLIGDGWSMELIFKNLITNYYTLVVNGEINQERPDIQYKDFASWVTNNKKSELFLTNKYFWKNVFKTPHSHIKLPIQKENYQNTAGKINFNGSSVDRELTSNFSDKIDSFCMDNHISPFNFFLSSLKVLIHYYTNINDIIIGTPVHGRLTKKLEDQLGLFINTIPIRTLINPEARFIDFLAEQHIGLAKYLDHQIFIPSEILDELQIDTPSNKSPFFDIIFVLQNQKSLKMPKLSLLEKIQLEIKTTLGKSSFAQFGLAFSVSKGLDETFYEIDVNFNVTNFEKENIEDFIDNYIHLLERLLENKTSTIEMFKDTVKTITESEDTSSTIAIKRLEEEEEVITDENILNIKNIFQKVLNIKETLKQKDDFFEKGGTSLKAIKLIIEVNKVFKTKISIVDFIGHSSMVGMYKLIFKDEINNQKETEEKLVITFNSPKEDLDDFFFIPPIIGLSLIFHRLANTLKNQFNCYGFNIPMLEDKHQFIPYMADLYVKEIKKLKTGKRINVLGYSIGATIAFEVVKKLEEEGVEAKLFVLDREPSIKKDINLNDDFVDEIIESHSVLLKGVKNVIDKDRVEIIKQIISGLKNHKTSNSIKGDIIAFEAKDNQVNAKMQLWETYTKGTFQKIQLKGNHFDVLNEENLKLISQNIF